MNRIVNVVALQTKDKFSWFLLPWIIVGSSFVINIIIAILIGGKSPIYTGGMSSIYIYMLVVGGLCVAGPFPLALGFSARRRDYYLGTTALAIAFIAT